MYSLYTQTSLRFGLLHLEHVKRPSFHYFSIPGTLVNKEAMAKSSPSSFPPFPAALLPPEKDVRRGFSPSPLFL